MSGALRVWDAARDVNGSEVESSIGLTMMKRDLQNSFQFYAIGFKGAAREVSFPCLVTGGTDGNQSFIGTVKYFYEPETKSLFRQKWKFPGTEPAKDTAEKIAGKVEDMSLRYIADRAAEGAWQETWNDGTNLPRAVRIDLQVLKKGVPVTLTRTVVSELTAVTNLTGGAR